MKGGRGKGDERGGPNVGPKFKGLQGEGMWHLIAVAKRQYRVRRAINELTQRWTRRSIRKKFANDAATTGVGFGRREGCSELKCHEKNKLGEGG